MRLRAAAIDWKNLRNIERLKHFRKLGMTIQECADMFGVNYEVIKAAVKRYRLAPVQPHKKWTEEEIKILYDMLADNKRFVDIAIVLRRTRASVAYKVDGDRRRARRKSTTWTKQR